MAYARNPSVEKSLFGVDPNSEINILEKQSCLVRKLKNEEIQISRAKALEAVMVGIIRNPALSDKIVDYYNKYLGKISDNPSNKVQEINVYNSGNLIITLADRDNMETTNKLIKDYEKLNINTTANTDGIQAAYLANLGKLYYAAPIINEENKETILEYFRTKLYKKPTSNSPIVQAAKYYSDGYYDAAYQLIINRKDKEERERELKILEEIRKEFAPEIEIDYSLE